SAPARLFLSGIWLCGECGAALLPARPGLKEGALPSASMCHCCVAGRQTAFEGQKGVLTPFPSPLPQHATTWLASSHARSA
uniref:Uncharacterized protein n=1 Tax=Crocodylus porosus TaxID=8502 RepID=A0A7M4ELP0_CROPO